MLYVFKKVNKLRTLTHNILPRLRDETVLSKARTVTAYKNH